MFDYYSYLKKGIFSLPPEEAHKLAIKFIKYNFIFDYSISEYFKTYLCQNIFNIKFDSPVGLAAGFDKNCQTYDSIHKCGFGFAEFGTVTPKPQFGNQKPRVFRIIENEALINSLGFNNDGIEKFMKNASSSGTKKIPIGINIGPNKDSINFIDDYNLLLENIFKNYSMFDYITINISSPNTKGLRDLHDNEKLDSLLKQIFKKQKELIHEFKIKNQIPFFLKISPDIQNDDSSLKSFIDVILQYSQIKALIISNTTVERSEIDVKYIDFIGGLSGKPLFEKSTELLRKIFYLTKNTELKLIGAGGISSAKDVYIKMKAGASLINLYTAMIYYGPFLANKINRELINLLQKDGFSNISEIIGIDMK